VPAHPVVKIFDRWLFPVAIRRNINWDSIVRIVTRQQGGHPRNHGLNPRRSKRFFSSLKNPDQP
jgi:hypothetical protein